MKRSRFGFQTVNLFVTLSVKSFLASPSTTLFVSHCFGNTVCQNAWPYSGFVSSPGFFYIFSSVFRIWPWLQVLLPLRRLLVLRPAVCLTIEMSCNKSTPHTRTKGCTHAHTHILRPRLFNNFSHFHIFAWTFWRCQIVLCPCAIVWKCSRGQDGRGGGRIN